MKVKTKKAKGLASFLCLLVAMLLAALYARSQDSPKEISIAFSNEKMDEAMKKLSAASGISLGYDAKKLARYSTPQVQFEKQTIDSILNRLFTGTPLAWKVINGYIIITSRAPGKVTGRVIDAENGQSVPNATIRIGSTGSSSAIDGSFVITLPEGQYEAEISSIGYGKKLVTDIAVKENESFPLHITLTREKDHLSGVVVRASARQESVSSLFTRQKNAASMSDGISAEQIRATPDKHIGETLKRITGVSTTDNKKVVVRGIAERYNVTMLDGATLPSTDVQDRDFEFNLIPSNLVDNVVVAKTITPDMLYGFAGGLVQISTKAIPSANFTSFSAGVSINTRTTGKDFMGYQRGKYDYLGFNDGSRKKLPEDLFSVAEYNPRLPDARNEIKVAQVGEQNRRIGGAERLGTRIFTAMPSQNYQFSLGRAYSLSKTKDRRLGFVGSLSYRNTQSNDNIADMRRSSWSQRPVDPGDFEDINQGNMFIFNTTWGALLNAGYKAGNHEITTRNIYTRMFDSRFSRIVGWTHERPKNDGESKFPIIEEDDRPKFIDLLQNKLSGAHRFSPLKIEWNLSRTILTSLEADAVSALVASEELANKAPLFKYVAGGASDPGFGPIHRDQYSYKERNLGADINVSIDFKLGKVAHTFKAGANYLDKHAWYDWKILPIVTASQTNNYGMTPIQEWGNYMSMEDPKEDLFYFPANFSLSAFEGKSRTTGAFAMFDQKLLPNLRLVWGLRADRFVLDTIRNGASARTDLTRKVYFKDSTDWYILPSVNIAYTLFNNLNIRGAYSKSVIRAGLMENAKFSRYNPTWGAVMRTDGVVSTEVTNYDAKIEWFPGAGEIISAGYFYKYFDKPAEFYGNDPFNVGRIEILATNSDWAKVKGWEFELRKSLGFIYPDWRWLKDIYLSGNLTLQSSEVRARNRHIYIGSDGKDSITYTYLKYKRALYGQVPVLYNLGLQYRGKQLGVNLVFNHMGYKTFITGSRPEWVEYERPRNQMDAQVSYRFAKGKMEARLNVSNLFDAPYRFYINDQTTYEYKPGMENASNWPANAEWNDVFRYRWGFSEKYEEGYIGTMPGLPGDQQIGDRKTFTRYTGRSFSLTVSYNF